MLSSALPFGSQSLKYFLSGQSRKHWLTPDLTYQARGMNMRRTGPPLPPPQFREEGESAHPGAEGVAGPRCAPGTRTAGVSRAAGPVSLRQPGGACLPHLAAAVSKGGSRLGTFLPSVRPCRPGRHSGECPCSQLRARESVRTRAAGLPSQPPSALPAACSASASENRLLSVEIPCFYIVFILLIFALCKFFPCTVFFIFFCCFP